MTNFLLVNMFAEQFVHKHDVILDFDRILALYTNNFQSYLDGPMQDSNKSIENSLELLQSFIKPSTWIVW